MSIPQGRSRTKIINHPPSLRSRRNYGAAGGKHGKKKKDRIPCLSRHRQQTTDNKPQAISSILDILNILVKKYQTGMNSFSHEKAPVFVPPAAGLRPGRQKTQKEESPDSPPFLQQATNNRPQALSFLFAADERRCTQMHADFSDMNQADSGSNASWILLFEGGLTPGADISHEDTGLRYSYIVTTPRQAKATKRRKIGFHAFPATGNRLQTTSHKLFHLSWIS